MTNSPPSSGTLSQGVDLSDFDWDDADLTDATFQDCQINNVVFSRTIFEGTKFIRCSLTNCRLNNVDARDIAFSNCILTDATSHKGLFVGFSQLERARFESCDLSFSTWERSDLRGLFMTDCNLRGSTFNQTIFAKSLGRKPIGLSATLRSCNLQFSGLTGLDFSGCNFEKSLFREADISGSNLEGANLADADLVGAIHVNTKLANADLRRAKISGLDLATLSSRVGMKITADQQHALLATLGIDVSV